MAVATMTPWPRVYRALPYQLVEAAKTRMSKLFRLAARRPGHRDEALPTCQSGYHATLKYAIGSLCYGDKPLLLPFLHTDLASPASWSRATAVPGCPALLRTYKDCQCQQPVRVQGSAWPGAAQEARP